MRAFVCVHVCVCMYVCVGGRGGVGGGKGKVDGNTVYEIVSPSRIP